MPQRLKVAIEIDSFFEQLRESYPELVLKLIESIILFEALELKKMPPPIKIARFKRFLNNYFFVETDQFPFLFKDDQKIFKEEMVGLLGNGFFPIQSIIHKNILLFSNLYSNGSINFNEKLASIKPLDERINTLAVIKAKYQDVFYNDVEKASTRYKKGTSNNWIK